MLTKLKPTNRPTVRYSYLLIMSRLRRLCSANSDFNAQAEEKKFIEISKTFIFSVLIEILRDCVSHLAAMLDLPHQKKDACICIYVGQLSKDRSHPAFYCKRGTTLHSKNRPFWHGSTGGSTPKRTYSVYNHVHSHRS